MLQYVEVCCSVLQCVAMCYSVLQYVAAKSTISNYHTADFQEELSCVATRVEPHRNSQKSEILEIQPAVILTMSSDHTAATFQNIHQCGNSGRTRQKFSKVRSLLNWLRQLTIKTDF